MFWLPFGTAAAVIGLALMTIGVTRTPSGGNLLSESWFDIGLALLGVGALLLLWSLALYLARRRSALQSSVKPDGGGDVMTEAVKGYYAERNKLFDMYGKQQEKERQKKR